MNEVNFTSVHEVLDRCFDLPEPDQVSCRQAVERDSQLTKPPNSLGKLEELACWFVSWRGLECGPIKRPQINIYAGNHGIARRGVSAFPVEVTEQMTLNIRNGGAAISQLAKKAGARLSVHEFDLKKPTRDFSEHDAMTNEELLSSLSRGWNTVSPDSDLLIVGEMGIGNTTSAAAISLAHFGGTAAEWVGRGTGVSDRQLALKAKLIGKAVEGSGERWKEPFEALRCLGGFEIAAMAGAILRARHERIPVILDGYICSSAAGALYAVAKGTLEHVIAGHCSAENAHARLLEELTLTPLLELGMRLGEASGAAVAFHVLDCALACHFGMATFAEARVSTEV